MGVFDLFGRDSKVKESRGKTAERPLFTEQGDAPLAVFEPSDFKDVERIIDALKVGKNAMVHLNKLKPETARRVIDMLSGAVYAIGGGVYEMQNNVFMFSPTGVEIMQ
ncbi:MAG: cell division protein SepF [Clostridia bacterium]|nr:cell division protein SepF [Clostridia bacterium]MBR5388460.1 cell division protein SepF [Clostridia bacterium]